MTTLVDQAANIITGWVSISDIWLDSPNHVNGGTIETDENTVVNLAETEKLHDLLALGGELVNTTVQIRHANVSI